MEFWLIWVDFSKSFVFAADSEEIFYLTKSQSKYDPVVVYDILKMNEKH